MAYIWFGLWLIWELLAVCLSLVCNKCSWFRFVLVKWLVNRWFVAWICSIFLPFVGWLLLTWCRRSRFVLWSVDLDWNELRWLLRCLLGCVHLRLHWLWVWFARACLFISAWSCGLIHRIASICHAHSVLWRQVLLRNVELSVRRPVTNQIGISMAFVEHTHGEQLVWESNEQRDMFECLGWCDHSSRRNVGMSHWCNTCFIYLDDGHHRSIRFANKSDGMLVSQSAVEFQLGGLSLKYRGWLVIAENGTIVWAVPCRQSASNREVAILFIDAKAEQRSERCLKVCHSISSKKCNKRTNKQTNEWLDYVFFLLVWGWFSRCQRVRFTFIFMLFTAF